MRAFLLLAVIGLFAAVVNAQPGDVEKTRAKAQLALGNLRFAGENYPGAIEAYTKCIGLDPLLAACYAGRGDAYSLSKNSEGAIADFTAQIRLDPNNYKPYLYRGSEYITLKKYDLALVDLNRSVQLNSGPENKLGVDMAAQVKEIVDLQKRKAELEQRKKDSEILASLFGGQAGLLLTRGNSEHKKKEYDKALATYTECLNTKPTDTGCYIGRGNVYWSQFIEKAASQGKKIADLGIADPLARNVIAEYGIASKLGGKNAAFATYYRGRFYHAMKQYAEAKIDYQKALELGLPDAESAEARRLMAALPVA